MGKVERLNVPVDSNGWSAAYANGVAEGLSARARNDELSPYVQVGIDDYAMGFRAGFFGRMGSDQITDGPRTPPTAVAR